MRTMLDRSLAGLVSWILITAAVGCRASDDFPSALDPTPLARFTASTNEGYGPLESPAEKQIALENQNVRANHFCVVGYDYPGRETAVWVHWREEERLLLWRPSVDATQREMGWVHSERDLKLGRDTVASEEDLQGSTFRVTLAWWKAIAQDCEAHGEKLEVPPFTPDPA